jgi:hypothetical protein
MRLFVDSSKPAPFLGTFYVQEVRKPGRNVADVTAVWMIRQDLPPRFSKAINAMER